MSIRYYLYNGYDIQTHEINAIQFVRFLDSYKDYRGELPRVEFKRHTIRENGVAQICLTLVADGMVEDWFFMNADGNYELDVHYL